MGREIGLPVKLFHEAEGHIVTLETLSGDIYRGQMVEGSDSMNIALQNVTHTFPDGRAEKQEHVYIRGGNVRFFILPDMLKNAPMFKHLEESKEKGKAHGLGIGRGVRSQQVFQRMQR